RQLQEMVGADRTIGRAGVDQLPLARRGKRRDEQPAELAQMRAEPGTVGFGPSRKQAVHVADDGDSRGDLVQRRGRLVPVDRLLVAGKARRARGGPYSQWS